MKRLEPLLRDGTFLLTYGDGRVCDLDALREVVRFHRAQGKIATVTGSATARAVRRPCDTFDGDLVKEFTEKAADRRGLDQRRLHGARARRCSSR